MDDAARRALIERYLAAYNAFDVEGMLETLADHVHFQNVSNGQLTAESHGRDAFGNLAEQGCAFFVTREQRVLQWWFHPDKVIVSIDYHGVLKVDSPLGPAGSPLRIEGESEFAFDDKRITRIIDRS